MSAFIIAEAGVNHNGSIQLALELIEAAAEAGADAVKFQSFSAEKLVRAGAEKADYQKAATGDGDQLQMLKKLELSVEQHHLMASHCKQVGIEFMSTPFDPEAAEMLLSLGMRRIKIPSGEITNHPFLRFLAAKNCPLIMSTGMATLAEVQEAVTVIANERERIGNAAPLQSFLNVLHCTSNYPASDSDVNLRAMITMRDVLGVPVGYSDHTLGVAVPTAAVALGATVIEKHFTLDKSLSGPDHKASLDPNELAIMVNQIRSVERALGSAVKGPADAELPIRALVRRSVTTIRPLVSGQIIAPEDLALLRPGTGIAPKDYEAVLGRRAARDIAEGTTLQWGDIGG
ncbi:N-acetylneuraminate synthase [Permianibacter sp. IMCC34836]|uniref:N-acetylneuraminate synthase n=1 Tax=Permianibacter fluminis TaxID=2738515 RepID=UPI0015521ABC|nr:N-acetylneuraminate synthase [Permianibacter fluminis]NQD37414.1 N-acetylneuraminate synthase [Permianibacter fluminis]